MTAMQEVRNAVEHALMNDEITIDTYESIVRTLDEKGLQGFALIPMEVEKAIVILP